MNTRLQVEHPVTEATTGLDLVELQLHVADGGRLDAEPPPSRGYSIEARLYAEDPAKGWQPQAGTVHRFDVPGNVRVDTGIVDGSVVSIYYDPMLAKVISYAPTRRQAAGVLADALARTRIHGVRTNRDLLVNVLRHPAFLDGATDTAFFDTHGLAELAAPLADDRDRRAVGRRRRVGRRRAEPPQRNGIRRRAQRLAQPGVWLPDQVLQRHRRRRTRGALPVHPHGRRAARPRGRRPGRRRRPERVVLAVDGVDRPFDVARYGRLTCSSTRRWVRCNSLRCRASVIPTPRSPRAHCWRPMPGSVLRIGAAVGDAVTAGQPLVWLEAMKMEHTVTAPGDGVLAELNVEVGQQVDVGAVLARVDS